MGTTTYKDAGVDIEKAADFTKGIYSLMRKTFDERVVELKGGFGGLFSLDYDEKLFSRNYRHPVLVASTDGVGTKLKVAFMANRHDTIGIDLVAMCVNDILVQGAEPLFFLDYMASGTLAPETQHSIVKGISEACRQSDCTLLGGETAEMPGFYDEGEYELAGFTVGVVEKHKLITGKKVEPGDAIIGLPSDGIHSNGYSLVRKVMFDRAGLEVGDSLEQFGMDTTVAEELLRPTRIYVQPVTDVLRHYKVKQILRGIAHITGGGLVENIPRVLPEGCGAKVYSERWDRPRIFDVIQKLGEVPTDEMYRVFNMGIGMVVMVPPYFVRSVLRRFRKAGEGAVVIGEVVEGDRSVTIE